jgi:hypothetical protein
MSNHLSTTARFIQKYENLLDRFKSGLAPADQALLAELFAEANRHAAAMAHAAHPLPVEMILLVMLLEEHKEILRLRNRIDREIQICRCHLPGNNQPGLTNDQNG